MAITNRNYLINRNKKKRDRSEKTGKKRVYFDKSCPKCGLPSEQPSSVALNRFGNPNGRNLKCKICGSMLKGD